MNRMECLGLDFLREEEETLINFMKAICEEGKAIVGYYGYPYLNREYGHPQFIVRTELDNVEKHLLVTGMDTHLSGVAVWDTVLSGMDLQPRDADLLTRRVVVNRESDGGGMAVVNLVNGDVLPSFLEGDRIKMQVVAFPELIHYFPDEEAYAAAQPEGVNGKKLLLADGGMLASGLLSNHAPDNPDHDKDHESDNYMLIRGTVKKIAQGFTRFGEDAFPTYVDTVIGTDFGDLEIVHTVDQVEEGEREFMQEGATVWGVFVLSGDVAIYEYSEGFVRDMEHNLALLRYTLQEGYLKRMLYVLDENAVYVSEASRQEFVGRETIVRRLQYVRDANPEKTYYAHLATVTAVDDGEEELPFGVGQRCVVLAENEETNYVSIAFLELDGEGNIIKLTVSNNGRYHFRIDKPVRPVSILDDFELPESVAEPIFSRARFHGFLTYETGNETVLRFSKHIKSYEENARDLIAAFDDYQEVDENDKYSNVFGYLFAKAIESDQSWRHGDQNQFRLVVHYSSEDAICGRIHTNLDPEKEERVLVAYDYGKQFYKDLCFFCGVHEEATFEQELLKALVIVQQIGEVYSMTVLDSMLEET